MKINISILKKIIEKSFSRYITILPEGFKLPYENKIYKALTVEFSSFHPVRTFYEKRKPTCRSIDGITSVKDKKPCASCILKKHCVSQICLEIIYQSIPLKLLLSYTSMRKFLLFINNKNIESLKKSNFTITVINRGKWGELKFY